MPVKFFKAMVIFSLLALILGFAPVNTVQAATYRTWVAQLPSAPIYTQTVRVWMNSDTVLGETAGVEIHNLTNSTWTKYLGTYNNTSYPGANWYADIPALPAGTQVEYQLFTRNEGGQDYGFTNFNWNYTALGLPAVVYVDDSWAGTAAGTDPDGSGPATNFGGNAFDTIQNGINGVAVGGTVNVAPGTYTGAVTVNKAITVQGIESAFGATPAIIQNVEVSVSAAGATLRNFKVMLSSDSNSHVAAIGVTGSNTTVADNYITEITGSVSGGTIKGIYINGGTSSPRIMNITVSGNRIENISTSIFKIVDGIQVQGAVDGVNITSNSINGLTAPIYARGIEVTNTQGGDKPAPINVLIQKNRIHTITAPGAMGVFIESGTDASLTTVYANSITDMNYYLINNGSGTLNASGNWFGSNVPSGFTGKFWGSVDYTPWMNTGDDPSTNPGFQGDLSTLWVNTSTQTGTTGRIVEAANMVEDGALTGSARQVKVLAGTYTETGTISRPVTVQSNAGLASTFVQKPDGTAITIASGGVTLTGFTFRDSTTAIEVNAGEGSYVLGNAFTGNTTAVNVSGGLAEIGGDLWSEKNTVTGGTAVAVSGGSAYVKGNVLTGNTTVFNHSAGTLNAYANSISGFTTAKSGTAVSNLKHNYWNTSSPNAVALAGLSPEDWQARLGAPITDWAEGSGSVSLQGATLSGTGRPQIVVHGDGATPVNRPFGSGKDPYVSQLCSDFYDLFAVDGTGTFDLSIPVYDKGGTLDCTTPLANRSLYWITSGTDYAAECLAFDDIRCWDSVGATKTVTINGSNLEVGGLTPAELGGTQIVIGDINGLDPTAIELVELKAHSAAAPTGLWTASLLGMLALLAALFIWKLRR